jgi:hypothetical protein
LFAQIVEFKRQFFHDVIVDAARDADTARIRQPLQTRGDIHPVAENISVLQHDVADIDADAKLHPPIFVELVVRVSQLVLDFDRALDSRQRAAECGQNAVAGGSANSALVLRDKTIRDQAKGRQSRQGSFLVDLHHAAIARDVSGKNGDEFSLEGRRFRLVSSSPPGDSEKPLSLREARV